MNNISAEAKSLADLVKEWVDGGISLGTDWRPGLEGVIATRLQRLRTPNEEKHPDDLRMHRMLANDGSKFQSLTRWPLQRTVNGLRRMR